MTRRKRTHNLAGFPDMRAGTACAFIVGIALVGMMLLATRPPEALAEGQRTAAAAPLVSTVAPAYFSSAAQRRVYPYSVVPGGVVNRAELANMVKSDNVVALHYASFNVDAARIVRLEKPRAVYVSYRKGDKIYWTANKVNLSLGEALLSDGVNEARTRCANRISDSPQLPISTDEPSLELPVGSHLQASMEPAFEPPHRTVFGGAGASPAPAAGSSMRAGVEQITPGFVPSFGLPSPTLFKKARTTLAPTTFDSPTPAAFIEIKTGVVPAFDPSNPEDFIETAKTLAPAFEPKKLHPFGPEQDDPWRQDSDTTMVTTKTGEVPEPATLSLMAFTLLVLYAVRRRRRLHNR